MKYLLIIMIGCVLCSCANATYREMDAEGKVTKELRQSVVGRWNMKDFDVNMGEETFTMTLGTANGDAGQLGGALEELAKSLRLALELAEKASGVPGL